MNYSEIITDLQSQVDELQVAIRVLGKLNKPEEIQKEPAKPKQIPTKPAKPKASGNGTRKCSKCGKVEKSSPDLTAREF